jgi:hypothetical protein
LRSCLDRIAELVKRKAQRRRFKEAQLAKKEAQGDFSHYKDKNGNFKNVPLPQPTLPNVGVEEFDDGKSEVWGGSNRGGGGVGGMRGHQYGDSVAWNNGGNNGGGGGWNGSNRGSVVGSVKGFYPHGGYPNGPVGNQWNGNGGNFQGYDVGHQHNASFGGYPGYAMSDVGMPVGYEPSVVDSQEPLNPQHPSKPGMGGNYHNGGNYREDNGDYGLPVLPYAQAGVGNRGMMTSESLNRAPSYKSEMSGGFGGQVNGNGVGWGSKEMDNAYEDLINGGGGGRVGNGNVHQQQQYYNNVQFDTPKTQWSEGSPNSNVGGDYKLPDRGRLFDKVGGGMEGEVGYGARDETEGGGYHHQNGNGNRDEKRDYWNGGGGGYR